MTYYKIKPYILSLFAFLLFYGQCSFGKNRSDSSIDVLKNLKTAWITEAKVNLKKEYFELAYDPSLPDFPMELLPFSNHPTIQSLNLEKKHKLLASAWVSYVDKTIAVERNIITRACQLITSGAFKLPANEEKLVKETIQQAAIDEEYHIYLTIIPRNISADKNGLNGLQYATPLVVELLNKEITSSKDQNMANLAILAFATVAETSTNAFLNLLSEDNSIQPMHSITTGMHYLDEKRHANLFRNVVLKIYNNMEQNHQRVFKNYLRIAYKAFTSPDYKLLQQMLTSVPVEGAEEILQFSKSQPKPKKMKRDNAVLLDFLRRIGMSIKELT
jgi:hypothetical protein